MSTVQFRGIWLFLLVWGSGWATLAWLRGSPLLAQSIDVRVERWLAVEAIAGGVWYLRTNTVRPARVGDRLTQVGDGLRTEQHATGILQVDTGIGTLRLREETEVRIQRLGLAPDNGRITHLYVPRGTVTLNLRRFTHPGSELQIETPAGVSGVRGTVFGVIVHPEDRRTGIATSDGAVFASAQARTVTVPAGYQTLIPPGEPPRPPRPIPAQPQFDYHITSVIRGENRYRMLRGQIDPINQVYVEGARQPLTASGLFWYEVPAYRGARVRVRVVTPLGDETNYDVPLL